tara:strand:- start:3051 stop:3371 length:321 start_codon:yes stop_codon:yes gene_type:complete
MGVNYQLIKERRLELGLTQRQVVAKVKELSGGLGQSGYVRIEQGDLNRSKYLPYICQALGIKLSEIDSNIDNSIEDDVERIFSQIQPLSATQQIEIAKKILENLKT